MCTPPGSLRLNSPYLRNILSERKIIQSGWLRAEAHCHQLNRRLCPAGDWPSQNMDVFLESVRLHFSRKNRIEN